MIRTYLGSVWLRFVPIIGFAIKPIHLRRNVRKLSFSVQLTPTYKSMLNPIKRTAVLLCVLVFSSGLFGQNEVHTFSQDGLAPAREISFDIRPFNFEELDERLLVSLEGMDLAVIEQGRLMLLGDGDKEVPVMPSIDGWYRIDVVKCYFSQDLEISVDGYPTLLMVPVEPLDLFLQEDQLVITSFHGSNEAVVGSLAVKNLSHAPFSILDYGNLSQPREDSPETLSSADSGTASEAGNAVSNETVSTPAETSESSKSGLDESSTVESPVRSGLEFIAGLKSDIEEELTLSRREKDRGSERKNELLSRLFAAELPTDASERKALSRVWVWRWFFPP